MPTISYGFEFQCSLIEYTKEGEAFVPNERISSGSVPIHAGLFHGETKDTYAARELAIAATTNLMTTAAIELAQPGTIFPLHPSTDREITAAQVHDLADAMASGKITATAYSLTRPDKHQILQFVITTRDL